MTSSSNRVDLVFCKIDSSLCVRVAWLTEIRKWVSVGVCTSTYARPLERSFKKYLVPPARGNSGGFFFTFYSGK